MTHSSSILKTLSILLAAALAAAGCQPALAEEVATATPKPSTASPSRAASGWPGRK